MTMGPCSQPLKAAGAGNHDAVEAAVAGLLLEVLEELGGFLLVGNALGTGRAEAAANEDVVGGFGHNGV